ncbi:MAG: deoxynucleoside kinase [Candidatus Marinimicrobia bacterium]|nr:deoxynucleoside kinase [Candidatus Neomarinimicrobiota bacterium]MBL7030241.1 deoxynucleoside kinase [Candidatus Neomarinimicrobiota bacterium]
MKKKSFIGLAGNIGVGKTTFTKKMADAFGWSPFYESVADNPYLSDFYGDMKRWSFNLQIYFLHHRFKAQKEILELDDGVVQDRTIYEDVEIFARNLHEMGRMDDRDWENYQNLFSIMTSYLRKPNLIIYLKASTDTLQTRIHSRGRDYENSIDPEYLHQLNVAYDQWIEKLKEIPVMIVETDQFNIFNDTDRFKSILEEVKNKLN